MSSAANPFYSVYGQNPTGQQIASPAVPGSGSTGQNPFLVPYGVSGGTSQIPGSSSAMTFPANTSGAPSVGVPGGTLGSASSSSSSTPFNPSGVGSGLGFPTTTSSQHQLYQNLEKTYGAGIAGALMQFLSQGAGFNQTAVNNLIAAMQPGFNQDQQDLLSSFSGSGNRFGSGAQIGLADLQSQQQLDVGQLESQMYEQAVQNYINTLMGAAGGTASRISGSPSTMDSIGSGLGLASDIGGALSQTGIGGTIGTIIGGIASL